MHVNITVTYLQGTPENVKLSASEIPEGTSCSFSTLQGVPTEDRIFNSSLIIQVSKSTPTESYLIAIAAVAQNGKMHNSSHTLSVIALDSVIKVSGTVDGGIGIIPNQITFEQLSSTGAHVQTFTAIVQVGQYSIFLPNKQFYAVSIAWTGSDGTSGTHYFIMPCSVNAPEGAASITIPFSWTDLDH